MTTIIGIDPGQSGGISVFCDETSPFAMKMPATETDLWREIVGISADVRRWGLEEEPSAESMAAAVRRCCTRRATPACSSVTWW